MFYIKYVLNASLHVLIFDERVQFFMNYIYIAYKCDFFRLFVQFFFYVFRELFCMMDDTRGVIFALPLKNYLDFVKLFIFYVTKLHALK